MLKFEETNHAYTLDGKPLISVTQLLKKHGLTTDFDGVDPEVLQRAAARGNLIHKEIEDYINNGVMGFTPEFTDFIAFSEDLNLTNCRAEVPMHNDLVAGTADLTAERKQGKKKLKVLIDHKTGSTVNTEAVRWQLSLYEYLSGETFDEFYVFHLCDKSKYTKLEHIPQEDLDALLDCERNGTLYKPRELAVKGELLLRAAEAERALKEAETVKKAAEENAKNIRAELLAAMEAQKIKSFETADKSMLITYIAPTTRETVDGARLKKDHPEIAKEYTKISSVKASVRVTVRG